MDEGKGVLFMHSVIFSVKLVSILKLDKAQFPFILHSSFVTCRLIAAIQLGVNRDKKRLSEHVIWVVGGRFKHTVSKLP